MINNIKCLKCSKVLASVDLPKGAAYKGDAHYGMYCPKCVPPPAMVSQSIEERVANLEAKVNEKRG